jgi:hypothetical protein
MARESETERGFLPCAAQRRDQLRCAATLLTLWRALSADMIGVLTGLADWPAEPNWHSWAPQLKAMAYTVEGSACRVGLQGVCRRP